MTTTQKSRPQRSRSSTTSRRSAGPPKPFTLEHFRVYGSCAILDNGAPFTLLDYQEECAADIFAGYQESWLVLPEGSGKTTFLALLGLYFGDYTPSAMIPIAASSREQAEIMYRQAEGLIARSPELESRFRAYDGYRRIKCLRTDGRIQVFAADDRTGDGIIPGGLALVDELHRHRDLKLYRTWRGKLEKRGAQMVTISTAGEPGGEFEETRSRIKKSAATVSTSREGCHTRAAGEDIVLHDFAVPSVKQADDMDVVARANPRPEVTAEMLRKKRESPTMTREHWLRFVCNIATLSGGSAIQPEEWDRLEEPGVAIPDGVWRTQFLDLGWKIDTTALGVLAWESPERRVVTGVQVFEPPVDESVVVAGILRAQIDYDADRVVLDPSAGAEQMVQLLAKGAHPLQTDDEARAEHGLPLLADANVGALEFIAHSQDNAPMSQAAARLDEAIRNGWLVHNGNRKLRSHVLNAVRRALGDAKFKFDRPADAKGERRKNYPIDALTGLLMGNNIAVDEAAPRKSMYENEEAII
jgi:phage terminase large subunit-like protein